MASVFPLADLRRSTDPFSWVNSIIKGDCVAALEALPDKSVDAIFADPRLAACYDTFDGERDDLDRGAGGRDGLFW